MVARRPLLAHRIAIGVGHVAKGRGAEGKAGDQQPRLADCAFLLHGPRLRSEIGGRLARHHCSQFPQATVRSQLCLPNGVSSPINFLPHCKWNPMGISKLALLGVLIILMPFSVAGAARRLPSRPRWLRKTGFRDGDLPRDFRPGHREWHSGKFLRPADLEGNPVRSSSREPQGRRGHRPVHAGDGRNRGLDDPFEPRKALAASAAYSPIFAALRQFRPCGGRL